MYTVDKLSDSEYTNMIRILDVITIGENKLRLELAFMCLWGVTYEYLIPEYSNYWKAITKTNLKKDIENISNVDNRVYSIVNVDKI